MPEVPGSILGADTQYPLLFLVKEISMIVKNFH